MRRGDPLFKLLACRSKIKYVRGSLIMSYPEAIVVLNFLFSSCVYFNIVRAVVWKKNCQLAHILRT